MIGIIYLIVIFAIALFIGGIFQNKILVEIVFLMLLITTIIPMLLYMKLF